MSEPMSERWEYSDAIVRCEQVVGHPVFTAPDGFPVAHVFVYGPEEEAKARLVAAAPELLAACVDAADDLDTWVRAFGDAAPSFAIAMDATASMLRDAIKHARGES